MGYGLPHNRRAMDESSGGARRKATAPFRGAIRLPCLHRPGRPARAGAAWPAAPKAGATAREPRAGHRRRGRAARSLSVRVWSIWLAMLEGLPPNNASHLIRLVSDERRVRAVADLIFKSSEPT